MVGGQPTRSTYHEPFYCRPPLSGRADFCISSAGIDGLRFFPQPLACRANWDPDQTVTKGCSLHNVVFRRLLGRIAWFVGYGGVGSRSGRTLAFRRGGRLLAGAAARRLDPKTFRPPSRAESTKVLGIVGQGSSACSSLVILKRQPTSDSRQ